MAKKHTFECLRKIFYWPLKLVFPVRVVGKENKNLPEKIITVTNHLSMLDIVIVGMNVPKYRHFVGKKELENSKFFKGVLKWAGVITIDRGKADMGAIKRIISTLRHGEGISIFPEGTRKKEDDGTMNEVKGGTAMFAFLALAGDLGATVSPAMVGGIADAVGGNLKTGLLFATLFPVVMIIGLVLLVNKFAKCNHLKNS